MKDEARSHLMDILRSYDAKLVEAERREEAIRAAQKAFPERFVTLKAKTILPALQELNELLSGCGHEVAVVEQSESSSSAGGVAYAAVSLRIVPKPFAHKSTARNGSAIEVAFSANRTERKVAVSSTNTILNSSGSHGKRASYDIDDVTADIVTNHVLQTLEEAFTERR